MSETATVTAPAPAPTNGTANGTSVRVEIFDQGYILRGPDPEYISRLAEYVDGKMRAVSEQASTVDTVRLAVLAALNIADEYHLLKRKYETIAAEYNRRATDLSGALEQAMQDERRAG